VLCSSHPRAEGGSRKCQGIFAALAEFGAPLENLKPADFEETGPFFRMGREPVGVDILTTIPGVDFDTAWEHRIERHNRAGQRMTAFFIRRTT